MSSFLHVNNKKKYILILGEVSTQVSDGTTLTSELKKYSINFTGNIKKFRFSWDFIGANSYLFVIGTEIHKFKAKSPESVGTPLCLANISKEFSVDNMKKIGLN